MAPSNPPPIHRFESWQVWPGSFDNPPIDGNFPAPPARGFAVTRATPIASMGSCFAREIKRRLVQRGFAYITEETDHPASVHASAAWERVYSTFCMRQIFEYTFEERWAPPCAGGAAPARAGSRTPIAARSTTTATRRPRPGSPGTASARGGRWRGRRS